MKLTPTNLHVLRDRFATTDEIPNRIHATERPHLSRLMSMGLIELGPGRATLQITALGQLVKRAGAEAMPAAVAPPLRKPRTPRMVRCPSCFGRKHVTRPAEPGGFTPFGTSAICPRCHGVGKVAT
jgi:hypothetical protein